MDTDVGNLIKDFASQKAMDHRKAIRQEMMRREEKRNEEEKKKNNQAHAQARRRERRTCLREQLRIASIQEKII
jgi:hypothetical protein